ncbi:hypothetical protein EV368DRAFT_69196 [Lentinula lateritia]|uniref:Uncharacterized protein n=1 Tax=Lentinula aff. lateritia TaxID=2804960 RepID=A0ACC1TXQ0_9AGAR|nr:hypothetical protein F5876DRAFT_66360 [Lentinula aff. lateritia]KAJ3847327.1 hypothetical protein EV368DRAFT_69196 [Lentinula lateritia]
MEIFPPPSTFTEPPLGALCTIADLYNWNYTNNPEHPVFVFRDNNTQEVFITYRQFVPAAYRAGVQIATVLQIDVAAQKETYPVVAILSVADTVTSYTTLVGMLQLGLTAFPISPRFSTEVIAHMLEEAQVTKIFVSELWLYDRALDAVTALKARGSSHMIIKIHYLPQFTDLYPNNGILDGASIFIPQKELNPLAPALMFPQVIVWTVRMNMQHALSAVIGSRELIGSVIGCPAAEPFHGIGLLLLFWMQKSRNSHESKPSAGITMGTFPPSTPSIIPTPDATFLALEKLRPPFALVSPRFLEEWVSDQRKINCLANMKGILFGGKPIRKMVGDTLASSGISLRNLYGSTESGHLTGVPSPHMGNDWEYFAFHKQCQMEFEPFGNKVFHAIVISNPNHIPPVINHICNDRPAYATGDLLIPHPLRTGYWKFLGRKDAQVMLSNGHVVNPAQIEEQLCEHYMITSAVVFGQGRPHLGVILKLDGFSSLQFHKDSVFNIIW